MKSLPLLGIDEFRHKFESLYEEGMEGLKTEQNHLEELGVDSAFLEESIQLIVDAYDAARDYCLALEQLVKDATKDAANG